MDGQDIDQPCYPELIWLVLTALGHVLLEVIADGPLDTVLAWMKCGAHILNRPEQVYNLIAAILWSAYVLFRAVTTHGLIREWGFRCDNFWSALRAGIIFTIPAAAAMMVYGVWKGHWPLPMNFWVLPGLYFIWGLAQQFALQVLVTRNLRRLIPDLLFRVLAASALFSASHFPNFRLMALTFTAGLALTWIYEKYRNIWAIGIIHGLLGALAYYLVLGLAPAMETIRSLQ